MRGRNFTHSSGGAVVLRCRFVFLGSRWTQGRLWGLRPLRKKKKKREKEAPHYAPSNHHQPPKPPPPQFLHTAIRQPLLPSAILDPVISWIIHWAEQQQQQRLPALVSPTLGVKKDGLGWMKGIPGDEM